MKQLLTNAWLTFIGARIAIFTTALIVGGLLLIGGQKAYAYIKGTEDENVPF